MYRQGQPGTVLDADALARGYVVATSSMLVNGQHANFVTAAETSLMLKEHVIERYGELQYTVGEGASGGALLQYLIADAYPGILDGLRPTQDWQDSLSGAYREFADSGVIMQAITFSSLSYSDAERAAIGGWGGTNVNIFNTESQRVVDYIQAGRHRVLGRGKLRSDDESARCQMHVPGFHGERHRSASGWRRPPCVRQRRSAVQIESSLRSSAARSVDKSSLPAGILFNCRM